MTLRDRRNELQAALADHTRRLDQLRTAFSEISSRIQQLQGALALMDELLAEEGNGTDASEEQGATALHGNEVRAGEGVKERKSQHGRVHHDGKAAS
jgi:ParB-like chromosome segregation protein Spo0J